MVTATDTEQGTISLTPGDWLVGEYIATKPEQGRPIVQDGQPVLDVDGRPRRYPDRWNIVLLIGTRTESVACRSEADAVEVTKDVTRGDQLVLPVYVRAAKGFTFRDLRKDS